MEAGIGMVSADVLATVLGFVAALEHKQAASQVSRAWRFALALPRAWSSTAVNNNNLMARIDGGGLMGRKISEEEVTTLVLRFGSGMRSLSVTDEGNEEGPPTSIITPALVAAIALYCPALRSLELRVCSEADSEVADAVVALVEGLAAGCPGRRIELFGCNLLRGDALARCGELVATMTSGECGGPECAALWGSEISAANFFEAPILPSGCSMQMLRCTQGCCSGAICTLCVDKNGGAREIMHCRKCRRACCVSCSEKGRGLGDAFECQGSLRELLLDVAYAPCPNALKYGRLLCAECCLPVRCSGVGGNVAVVAYGLCGPEGACLFDGGCMDCYRSNLLTCAGCGGIKCPLCCASEERFEDFRHSEHIPLPAACHGCGDNFCLQCREGQGMVPLERCEVCLETWCRGCLAASRVEAVPCSRCGNVARCPDCQKDEPTQDDTYACDSCLGRPARFFPGRDGCAQS